jgi:hypothetical protein
MTQPELERIFTFGRLSDEQREACKELFRWAFDFAKELNGTLPESPEKERALACVHEAVLWADAAIAIRSQETPGAVCYQCGGPLQVDPVQSKPGLVTFYRPCPKCGSRGARPRNLDTSRP